MKIISVSRRTDIPAFYPEWFVNRIRAGFVSWANPFSKSVYQTSLRPEDVMALVFWSKNYIPLLPHLDELDDRGYRAIFHFTITGLPGVFEPHVPDVDSLIKCARDLSSRYGPDAVMWRYDPVLISNVTDRAYHLRRFTGLCEALEEVVKRCYFSFTTFYRKVQRNTEALRREAEVICHDIPTPDRIEMANTLAEIAAGHGIEMFACCSEYLVGGKVHKAHCVDAELLYRLYPDKVGRLDKLPTRDGCGCCKCTDIGAYDTCPHGCVYCYANTRPQVALRNFNQHDPLSDNLCGPSASVDANVTPSLQF